MTRRKMTEKEIDKLLDDVRFYIAFGIFRFPVMVKKGKRR